MKKKFFFAIVIFFSILSFSYSSEVFDIGDYHVFIDFLGTEEESSNDKIEAYLDVWCDEVIKKGNDPTYIKKLSKQDKMLIEKALDKYDCCQNEIYAITIQNPVSRSCSGYVVKIVKPFTEYSWWGYQFFY